MSLLTGSLVTKQSFVTSTLHVRKNGVILLHTRCIPKQSFGKATGNAQIPTARHKNFLLRYNLLCKL